MASQLVDARAVVDCTTAVRRERRSALLQSVASLLIVVAIVALGLALTLARWPGAPCRTGPTGRDAHRSALRKCAISFVWDSRNQSV
jgi:hypothetical protein